MARKIKGSGYPLYKQHGFTEIESFKLLSCFKKSHIQELTTWKSLWGMVDFFGLPIDVCDFEEHEVKEFQNFVWEIVQEELKINRF